jgi:hypothetical protein
MTPNPWHSACRMLKQRAYPVGFPFSKRMKEFARRPACVPFRRFVGGVRREYFMQRFSVVLRGALSSYLIEMLCWRAVLTLLHAPSTPRA